MACVSPPVQPCEVLQGAPLDVPQPPLMSPWPRPPLGPRGLTSIRLEVRETFVDPPIITHAGDPTAVGVTQRGHAVCLYFSIWSLCVYMSLWSLYLCHLTLFVDVSAVDTGLMGSGVKEGNSGNLRPWPHHTPASEPEPEVGWLSSRWEVASGAQIQIMVQSSELYFKQGYL